MTRRNAKKRTTRRLAIENLQQRCLMAVDLVAAGLTDFGDAPDTYGTTLVADGARHIIGGFKLGKTVDAEIDGQPSGSAKRDGLDEDGVRFLGTDAVIVGNGAVDAWADTNGNGKFDSGEKFIDGVQLSPGDNYFTAPDAEYYRFRVSEKGGLDATGFGGFGEVEDYRRRVPVRIPPCDPPKDPVPPPPHVPTDSVEDRDESGKELVDPVQPEDEKAETEKNENEEARQDDAAQATLDRWLKDTDSIFARETNWLL